ncbi:MAG: carboxypeptidase-like regulatory domain-containing protein, partial [bacterium]|nr:carboxypeptidase-like regulatory domain-containing protein [bacterium]
AYIISNAAAPQTYELAVKGSLFGLMDPTPNVAAIRTHVGEVCRCDLVVRHTPRVLFKFQDQQQVPVRAYTLNIEAFNEKSGQGIIGALAAAADADGWYCVPDDFMQNRTVLRAVQAFSTASLMAETNNVPVTSARTNFIVLTGVLYTNGITVCGYLYDCNGEPVIDTLLDESTDQQSFGDTRTDHLGFFEFTDASGPTGGLVCLSTYTQDTIYRTNVVVSTAPIVWQLPPLRTVRGRVCLERADTPATNFAVGLGLDSQYACNDADGRFVLPTRENAGVVYAWVGNYAPVQAAFRLDASGQCDIGDLIVRAAAGTLRGRVVNERAQPLVADVALLRAGRHGEQLDAQSDAQDGRFEFTCLPTGAYQVVACKSGQPGAARSAWVALDAHAVVELPDLVLQMTNAALVRLTFVMADGTPAAYMHTSLINATTDEQGAIEDYVRLGQYNDVRLEPDGALHYSTEPFTITAATRELRVTVRAAPLR